jgi:hypothetical protein
MTAMNSDIIIGTMRPTTSVLTGKNRWDHVLARVGVDREGHRVEPGLYALGRPSAQAPVFVSANYTLSFDALRSNLAGMDAYILVLDTRGINVWCAAGKGTFGTAEIIKRVTEANLAEVVAHRKLVVPQLGAPGVAAHEVRQATGFTVEYGPVRAADLPEFMKTRKASAEMRRVRFSLMDRLVLVPVELSQILLILIVVGAAGYFLGGIKSALAVFTVFLAGLVMFPALLPWLPTHDFSSKGFFLGLVAAAPFAAASFMQNPDWIWYRQVFQALGFALMMPSAIAFLALNFTGSTTFTSRLGVRKEINTYFPIMTAAFGTGLAVMLLSVFIR